ncbi:hypothetical protein RB195_008043 [Necator americanus]|uniref:Secreted protein n=1 Tax=Necator americanus TaxID=51031 RepID=A0ABR1C2N3_NECAM
METGICIMNILMAFRIECVTAVAAAAVVVASRRRHLKRLSPFGVLYPKEYLRQATWTLTSRARHLSISPRHHPFTALAFTGRAAEAWSGRGAEYF